jgi:hypothetical protein
MQIDQTVIRIIIPKQVAGKSIFFDIEKIFFFYSHTQNPQKPSKELFCGEEKIIENYQRRVGLQNVNAKRVNET